MEKPPNTAIVDSNNNFSVYAAFSNISSNNTALVPVSNSNLDQRPKTPKKDKNKKSKQNGVPYAMAFLNSLRYENALPYRQFGADCLDMVRTCYPFIYRINDGVSNNTVLQQVCEERGWSEFKDSVHPIHRERILHDDIGWNMWWSYNFYQTSPNRSLKVWQFTNHNPRPFLFCNKGYLNTCHRKLIHEHGDPYDFVPKTFNLPEDFVRFLTEHVRRKHPDCLDSRNVVHLPVDPFQGSRPSSAKKKHTKPLKPAKVLKNPIWISKPLGKSQGKGIYITMDASIIANEGRSVIQEYISRPHLIGGYKWDLRIYVCVASTDPLTIYLYREGLCRFATEKYDLGDLSASFSHLTNASLNKLGPDYSTAKEIVGSGCKWSLRQLRKHFKDCGISDWYMWQRIMSMVVLTIVGEALKSGHCFPSNKNCFDFFGFDILVDEDLRPWLLEVNYSPGLGGDCEVDEIVKKPMLHELFDLLQFPKSSDVPISYKQTIKDASIQSKLVLDIDRYLRSPCPVAKSKLPIDYSCKGRLKEASSVYSQDLVAELIEKYSRDPHFKLTKSMKAILSKKKAEDKIKKSLKKSTNFAKQKLKADLLQMSTVDENGNPSLAANLEDINGTNVHRIDRASCASSVTESEISRPSSANSVNQKNKKGGPSYLYIRKQDWSNPPKTSGDWKLVHPCKIHPYKSPYRSSVSDLRGIVKMMDSYLQIARFVFKTYPGCTDKFYKAKMKALYKWDVPLWVPPEEPTDENDEETEDEETEEEEMEENETEEDVEYLP